LPARSPEVRGRADGQVLGGGPAVVHDLHPEARRPGRPLGLPEGDPDRGAAGHGVPQASGLAETGRARCRYSDAVADRFMERLGQIRGGKEPTLGTQRKSLTMGTVVFAAAAVGLFALLLTVGSGSALGKSSAPTVATVTVTAGKPSELSFKLSKTSLITPG